MTAEFADACLAAAARWDGISEPDTLHNTFNAARAYARLGRHAEAAALFAEAMPKVDVPYDQTGIAQSRVDYGRSLRATGAARRKRPSSSSRGPGSSPTTRATAKRTPSWPPMPRGSLSRPGRMPRRSRRSSGRRSCSATLGNTVARVRCQRSAAWVEFRMEGHGTRAGSSKHAFGAR